MASPEITLTHLDEPLFDGADATKRDLVDYLEAVGDRFVSVLSGRPLSVIRVRAGQHPFMQKNVPDYAPRWIKTVSMWAESSRRQVRYVLCEDKELSRQDIWVFWCSPPPTPIQTYGWHRHRLRS
jgi:bifunctional non-homologous end joining protein LigD